MQWETVVVLRDISSGGIFVSHTLDLLIKILHKSMSNKVVCTQCGYVGKSKRAIKGNDLIEIILWLFFIIPGLIYSIWRSSSRYRICPDCKSASLIPVNSTRARKIMIDNGMTEIEVSATQHEVENSFISKNLSWFRTHPVYTTLILLIGLPMLVGMISAIFN